MTNIQYHGKVYRSKGSGRLFTKTPYGNVLYKHPVYEPTNWTASKMSFEEFNKAINLGYMVKVGRFK